MTGDLQAERQPGAHTCPALPSPSPSSLPPSRAAAPPECMLPDPPGLLPAQVQRLVGDTASLLGEVGDQVTSACCWTRWGRGPRLRASGEGPLQVGDPPGRDLSGWETLPDLPAAPSDQASPHTIEASPPSSAICDQCHEPSTPMWAVSGAETTQLQREAGDPREDLRGRTSMSEDRDSGNGPH